MEIFQKRRNILATTSFYPLQLLNYDRDAATDPYLQNNADPRVRSASQVGKRLTNILIAVTIYKISPSITFCFATACAAYASNLLPHAAPTLAICYRMRRLR